MSRAASAMLDPDGIVLGGLRIASLACMVSLLAIDMVLS
jgi:hypothetical protein